MYTGRRNQAADAMLIICGDDYKEKLGQSYPEYKEKHQESSKQSFVAFYQDNP